LQDDRLHSFIILLRSKLREWISSIVSQFISQQGRSLTFKNSAIVFPHGKIKDIRILYYGEDATSKISCDSEFEDRIVSAICDVVFDNSNERRLRTGDLEWHIRSIGESVRYSVKRNFFQSISNSGDKNILRDMLIIYADKRQNL